jgi:hypothetical protein
MLVQAPYTEPLQLAEVRYDLRSTAEIDGRNVIAKIARGAAMDCFILTPFFVEEVMPTSVQ